MRRGPETAGRWYQEHSDQPEPDIIRKHSQLIRWYLGRSGNKANE